MDLTIGGKLEAQYWMYADDAVSSPYTCSSCLGFDQTMQMWNQQEWCSWCAVK